MPKVEELANSKPMTVQQIIQDFLEGVYSQTEAENEIGKAWAASGADTAQMNQDLTGWYEVLRNTPLQKNPGPTQGFVPNPKVPPVPMGTLLTPSLQTANTKLEGTTDPLTAYLARLGIGSKQNYNPAEAYQAKLFDPYKGQYQTEQRLTSGGAPFQDPTKYGQSFSDFLSARGGGGIQGLISGAQGQLRNIFSGTSEQKTGAYDPEDFRFGLGYEPGKSTKLGATEMDSGQIGELQDLLKYALQGQGGVGSLGALYASKRLPAAQQAYYGQKAAGQLGGEQVGTGPMNFVDWLKQNWGLQF